MSICKNQLISQLLQCFIYTMNDSSLRSIIIDYYINKLELRNKFQNLGTWYINYENDKVTMRQQKNQKLQYDRNFDLFIKKNKHILTDKTKLSIFTVCVLYDLNSVHFVSFIYDPLLHKLFNFDSGYEVYPLGQKVINKCTRYYFHINGLISSNRMQSSQNFGRCEEYSSCGNIKRGIQYNGNHQSLLPADAFCQTWSLWYLIREMKQYVINDGIQNSSKKKYDCIKNWCKMFPSEREFIIITSCVIPWLTFIPEVQKVYMNCLQNEGLESLTIAHVLSHINHYTEECFFANYDDKILKCHHNK